LNGLGSKFEELGTEPVEVRVQGSKAGYFACRSAHSRFKELSNELVEVWFDFLWFKKITFPYLQLTA
jgi:hypothetical protein